jgi:hypothetical protein
MNRVVSFTNDGDIRVESESAIEVIQSGVVLLTLEQALMGKRHGWKLDGRRQQPFSKETTPWLYSVRR